MHSILIVSQSKSSVIVFVSDHLSNDITKSFELGVNVPYDVEEKIY